MNTMIPNLAPVENGDILLSAFSGGPDSVCMTRLLLQIPTIQLRAVHYNHHLRGEESNHYERFVREFCEDYQIPLTVGEADVYQEAQKSGEGVEACGRRLRYAFMEQCAQIIERETGRKVWIATAHTASDQAETVLFRLARGTSLTGLGGIPYQRGRILRPILQYSRKEVEEFLRIHHQNYVIDTSNLEDLYARNRIRHHVLPDLETVHPGASAHVARTASLIQEDAQLLSSMAEDLYQKAETANGLCISVLKDAPLPLQRRMLAIFLERADLSISDRLIRRILSVLNRDFYRETIGQTILSVYRGELIFEKVASNQFEPVLLNNQELIRLPNGKNVKIQILDTPHSKDIHNFYKNDFYVVWDCDKICGVPVIRTRLPGDQFRPYGRGCTKSLKKLFAEKGILPSMRDTIAVFCDEKGIFAVEGFGVSERVRCDQKTVHRMVLQSVQQK